LPALDSKVNAVIWQDEKSASGTGATLENFRNFSSLSFYPKPVSDKTIHPLERKSTGLSVMALDQHAKQKLRGLVATNYADAGSTGKGFYFVRIGYNRGIIESHHT
jgi:hypothetical protein